MSKKVQKSSIPTSKQFSGTHFNKALNDQTFFVADPNQRTKTASYIKMSGAVTGWAGKGKNADRADFIFLVEQRLAGDEDDVRTILQDYHRYSDDKAADAYTDDVIEELIEGAITKSNYKKEMKAEYEAELDSLKAHVKEAESEQKDLVIDAEAFIIMSKHLTGEKGPVISKVVNGKLQSGVATVTVKRKTETPKDKLIVKLKEAEKNGRVVDVTDLGADGKDQYVGVDGTPKSHLPKHHFFIEGIPIQSSDYDNYVLAVGLWKDSYDGPNKAFPKNSLPSGYADTLANLKETSGRRGRKQEKANIPAPGPSRRNTPARSRSQSPSGSPKSSAEKTPEQRRVVPGRKIVK